MTGVRGDAAARGDALRALHVPGAPVVLPNVWDAASARAVVEAGFPAVATGSAAVAASLGHEDGEEAPVGEVLAAVARIVRAAGGVPVTADMERGYGLPPKELAERLAETGAVGCNLEDSRPGGGGLVDADEQAGFLAEFRAAAGPSFVLNARVDPRPGDGRLAEAVRRARLYAAAGADCVYPIWFGGEAELREIAAEAGAPVNALFRPGSPDLSALAAAGVARITFGPGLQRAALGFLGSLLGRLRDGRDPYGA